MSKMTDVAKLARSMGWVPNKFGWIHESHSEVTRRCGMTVGKDWDPFVNVDDALMLVTGKFQFRLDHADPLWHVTIFLSDLSGVSGVWEKRPAAAIASAVLTYIAIEGIHGEIGPASYDRPGLHGVLTPVLIKGGSLGVLEHLRKLNKKPRRSR